LSSVIGVVTSSFCVPLGVKVDKVAINPIESGQLSTRTYHQGLFA